MAFLQSLHLEQWILINTIILLLCFILIFISWRLKRKIKKSVDTAMTLYNGKPESVDSAVSDKILYAYSDYVEKLSRIYGQNLPVLTNLDTLWIEKLKIKPTSKNLRRLLKYSPEKSLFDIMNAAMENPSLKKIFTQWIENSGEFMILKKIAVSGNGRSFDGKKAGIFFKNETESLIEMTGDPLWQCRYFAYRILVHINGQKIDRILKAGFKDSSQLVRITLINLYNGEDREFVYRQLLELFLKDPVFDVRKSAKTRITSEFHDLYTLKPETLDTIEKIHLIELLDTSSKIDENIGLSFLKSGEKELELYAARYLSKTKTLSRMLLDSDPGDEENFNRTFEILKTASSVNCTDFLKEIRTAESQGPLILASRILQEKGDRALITPLIKKAVELYGSNLQNPLTTELYRNALNCACKRGNDAALDIVADELKNKFDFPEIQKIILPLIPERADTVFAPLLMSFIKRTDYRAIEELVSTISTFPPYLIMPQLVSILRDTEISYPFSVRKNALLALGKMSSSLGILNILENLTVFSLEEAKEYTTLLAAHDKATLITKSKLILNSVDSGIRSHLIAALPLAIKKQFLPEILSSLNDSDPGVRISCVWALSDVNEDNSFKECFPLLHDPVEEVRIQAAKALCIYGSDESLDHIEQTLLDDREIDSVKRAILQALGTVRNSGAFKILTTMLLKDSSLSAETARAIVFHDSPENIRILFNLLKETSPGVKSIIENIILEMGQKAEIIAKELLINDDPLLKESALKILDSSGLIDETVRALSHRDPEERYRAAEFLILAGTTKAYRGLICGVKDPVKSIRTLVIKAIDRLSTPEGNMILEELKNDPDKKVRQYTLWALERAEAKTLYKKSNL